MFADLLRAICAAIATVALPGYFWAVFLRPASGLAERLAYSSAVSLATVPVVAVAAAHIAGSGISLWMAILSAGVVLASGLLAVTLKGAARGRAGPILPSPQAITDPRALALLAVAFAAAFLSVVRGGLPSWLPLLILGLLILAAVVAQPAVGPSLRAPALTTSLRAPPVTASSRAPATSRSPATLGASVRAPALAIVLAATAARAYVPVIRFDWPSVRGLDHYSHAVMAEQMLAHGAYPTYLIYPPGFATMTAVTSRLSGLPPLTLYPVLAPMLLVLTALGAYALATRLWGWGYGIAAAALAGLVLTGSYAGMADGRYPDLTSAYFLITVGIAALLSLYESPSLRSAALAAVLGAAPVFYHSVATLYEAIIAILAALTALPCLLLTGRRREGRMVALALAMLALLSTGYAWYTYGFGWPVVGHSASSAAVSMVLGSQQVSPARHLLAELAPPVVWLGVLGLAILAAALCRPNPAALRTHRVPAHILAAATMVGWCVLMYLGSRIAADGFPLRFERDLGAGLSVTGGLAAGVIARSVWLAWQRARLTPAAITSLALAIPAILVVGVQTMKGVRWESRPAHLLAPPVVAAGTWLGRHNTGGTIVSTGMNLGITERSVLAMGGYPGLMYYGTGRTLSPRSLPPAGRQPLRDSQEVLEHPESCAAAQDIASDEVRYVVLYREARQDFDLQGFQADQARYHMVFENRSVIIYAAAPRGWCRRLPHLRAPVAAGQSWPTAVTRITAAPASSEASRSTSALIPQS